MTSKPIDGPYLCDQEPTFREALQWFPEMQRPWGAVGWKDHLFEFVVFWNGSLGMPVAGPPNKIAGLEHLKATEAQLCFFPTAVDNPWRRANMCHAMDEHSTDAGLEGTSPVMVFEHRDSDFVVRQRVFGHVPGAKRLRRGDEPLFAWMRFELSRAGGRAKRPDTFYLWTHVGAFHSAASMTPGLNTVLVWPAPAYAQRLSVVDNRWIVQTDGRARFAVLGRDKISFRSVQGGPNQDGFLCVPLNAQVGATVDFVVPFLPVELDVLEKEAALGWETALDQTLRFWQREYRGSARITVPDDIPTRSIAVLPWQLFTLAERNPCGDEYALNTGAFHYEGAWATPFGDICAWGLDYLGFHEEADRYLELYRTHQGEIPAPSKKAVPHDGFLTTPPRYAPCQWQSDHGALLYASAVHALLTDDEAFIAKWLPVWEKGLDWIRVQRAGTRQPHVPGLLPPAQATDDEQHFQFVWNDAWAWWGMCMVVQVLKRLKMRSAKKWAAEADDYRKCFLRAMRRAARQAGTFATVDGETHPFVPTNLDRPLAPVNDEAFYLDTGPLFPLYVGLIPPHDPLADAILAYFRKGPNLELFRRESSPWQPPVLVHELSSCEPCWSWNIGASLERRDRVRFVEGLFSMFSGGQSRTILWDIESRNGVFGCCGPKPVALHFLRHAFVYEHEDRLELLRLPPRDWLREEGARFENLPTWFGRMSLHARLEDRTLHLRATLPTRNPYRELLLNVPDLGHVERVVVNGETVEPRKGMAILKPPKKGRLEARIEYA